MKSIPFYIPSIPRLKALSFLARALFFKWLTNGPLTQKFRSKISRYLKTKHAVPLSSGTAALQLALHLSDVGEGDEVILPANTFVATLEVVLWRGATPVMVDIDPDTWNIDIKKAALKITSKTKALIAVPFAGLPLDMEALVKTVKKYDLRLILDNAHALEAKYQGRFLHEYADYSCYSFYATKNLTTGEGGLLICSNAKEEERARVLAQHGMSKNAWKRYIGGTWRYDIEEIGYKFNFTDINAAIGLAQIPHIESNVLRRKKLFEHYRKRIAPYKHVRMQKMEGPLESAYHLCCVWFDPEGPLTRDQFMLRLEEERIGYSVHFIPLYHMSAVKEALSELGQPVFQEPAKSFPANEAYFQGAVTLPLYVSLKKSEIDRITALMAP